MTGESLEARNRLAIPRLSLPRPRPRPRPLGALSLNRLSIKLRRPELAPRKQAQAKEPPPGPGAEPGGNPHPTASWGEKMVMTDSKISWKS